MAIRDLTEDEKKEIDKAKSDWEKANAAGDEAGKAAAHSAAEAVRARAGFSGGEEGSERIELPSRDEPRPTDRRERTDRDTGRTATSQGLGQTVTSDLGTLSYRPEEGKIRREGSGYAYTDEYGFPHVVKSYETAQKYAQPGSDIKLFTGQFGGGYGRGQEGERLFLDLEGSRDFGNIKDDTQERLTTQAPEFQPTEYKAPDLASDMQATQQQANTDKIIADFEKRRQKSLLGR